MNLHPLYRTLSQRKRPEDVAEMIISLLKDWLSVKERLLLEKAAKGSLRKSIFGYSSMSQEFRAPVGAFKQVSKAAEIFKIDALTAEQSNSPELVNEFIEKVSPLIKKELGQNDFLQHRLNREARAKSNLDISKRQYNKRWRLLKRLENKLATMRGEILKSEFEKVAKHGFSHQIELDEFSKDSNYICNQLFLSVLLVVKQHFCPLIGSKFQ